MKIKVTEAATIQLDWMVATAEGHSIVHVPGRGACRFLGVQVRNARGGYELMPLRLSATLKMAQGADYPGVFFSGTQYWCPSTNWAQGGPIIERKFIELNVMACGQSRTTFDTWLATISREDEDNVEASGPAPLIAAMRCYVASKLGDEVEVPEELK